MDAINARSFQNEPGVRSYFQDYGRKIRPRQLQFGRQHYSLGVAPGVREAIHCSYENITIVELGVAAGGGLLELCTVADFFSKEFGLSITIHGSDTGDGLPKVAGYVDHPEFWHTGAFKMDEPALHAKLPSFATLPLGDVSDTIPAQEADLQNRPQIPARHLDGLCLPSV